MDPPSARSRADVERVSVYVRVYRLLGQTYGRGSPLTGPPLPTSGVVRIVVVPPPSLSRRPLSLSPSVSSSRVIPPVVMVTRGLEPPPAANQSSRPGWEKRAATLRAGVLSSPLRQRTSTAAHRHPFPLFALLSVCLSLCLFSPPGWLRFSLGRKS